MPVNKAIERRTRSKWTTTSTFRSARSTRYGWACSSRAIGTTSLDLQNSNGTFTFASNNAYVIGLANTYQQRQGGTPVNFAQYQLGLYAQDDWTLSKKLSLSLGVRQELQNTLGDRLNLAPRIGFTWAPSKWTVRGGWGIFNDWYDSSVFEQTLLVNGVNQSDLVILRPGYPDPYDGTIASVLPPSVVESASGLRMPHLSQASVGVERNWGDLRVQTSYMVQRSLSQLRSINTNAPSSPTGPRPDEDLGTVTTVESTSHLAVDRLQVNVNWSQPQRRLLFGLNYILSSTKNSADSAMSLPSDSLHPDLDYGPSLQDARHRFFALASFGLPLKMRTFITSQFNSALPYRHHHRPRQQRRLGQQRSAGWCGPEQRARQCNVESQRSTGTYVQLWPAPRRRPAGSDAAGRSDSRARRTWWTRR